MFQTAYQTEVRGVSLNPPVPNKMGELFSRSAKWESGTKREGLCALAMPLKTCLRSNVCILTLPRWTCVRIMIPRLTWVVNIGETL